MTKRECQLVSELRSAPQGEAPESPQELLLSPRRAFVVQFRGDPAATHGSFTGRVEHMVSGHAARFHSHEELWAFFIRILGNIQKKKGVIKGKERMSAFTAC